jgi:putative ABC transport system permease protein
MQFRIVGVIKDFNTHNLGYMGQETGNMLGYHARYNRRYLAVNYDGTSPLQVINQIQEKWNEVYDEPSLMYFFLNDSYRQVYKSELVQRKLFLLFALTTILIACFGLFAMAYETIVQRTKEIGIRKVNGAKISEILNLLIGNYIRIIIIAVIPGLLIGYLISSNWLKEYAIKISISWYFFILPFVVLGCITLVSVMYHSYKAAVSNPIEALKYE